MIGPTRQIDRPQADALAGYTAPLADLVRDAARRAPDALAIVDGERRIHYAELDQLVDRAARLLVGLGVARGDVVTVQLPNWWEANVIVFAALRVGAVVNPVVPIYRHRELRFIVEQAAPRLIVVPHRFRGVDHVEMVLEVLDDVGARAATDVVAVRADGATPDGCADFASSLPADAPDQAASAPAPTEIALLLYTSGTTADPKGVLHDHRTLALENDSIVELFDLDGSTSVFMPSPVTHITGLLYGVLLPPSLAVPVTLMDVWDPRVARRLLDHEGCTFTVGATPFLQGLVDVYAAAPGRCPLQAFACGGADVPPELVVRARERLDATVVRIYGSSEFPTVSSGGPLDHERVAATTDGRPIGAVECRIAAPDHDGVGELEARGPELFLGYLDGSVNDESFTSAGWFRTGDLASIDRAGAVTIRGRRKDIILRGGENISAKEIEDLLHEHPDVKEVAVVAMPDPVMTEKACAVVVPVAGRAPTLDELTSFLETHRLARQKLPERLELVDELPATASGKVQKFVLREWIAGRMGSDGAP